MNVHEDRWSFFKICAVWAIFSCILVVGLPLFCSSKIDSHPSENTLYQWNHCSTMYSRLTINVLNHFKCFCSIRTSFPAKTNRCTLFNCFSITIYEMDKTDKLHHVANMYLTVNSSSWNLAWQTSISFMEIALLVLCFRSTVAKLTRQTLQLECTNHSDNSVRNLTSSSLPQ